MFTLLRDLGTHLSRTEGISELGQISEPLGDNYVYGLAICFDRDGEFRGVRLTEGQDGIIYKFGNPRGNDYTLVSKTSATTENVVPRLKRNASKILGWADEDDERVALIERCHATVEDQEDEIVEAVLKRYPEDASADKSVFAYWALVEEDALEPLCQMQPVKDFLAYAVFNSYAERAAANVRMLDEGGTCSICGDTAIPVYGNFSEIACYNIDKPGFITGGFSYAQTTDNFPVCRSCILAVRGGKEFVEDKLDFYMAGLNYWLLPDAHDEDVYRVLLESIKDTNRQTLGKQARSITADEEEILGYISDVLVDEKGHEPVTLNFFFYESSQGAWRIIGEMRRVLPSRIQELYGAKSKVEDRPDAILSGKEADDGYHFHLPRLRPFCGSFDSQDDRKLIRYLEAIFQGDAIRESTVVSDLVGGILSAHKDAVDSGNAGRARYTIRDAWATYLFLDSIDAIRNHDEGESMTIDYEDDNGYTQYIEANQAFFDDPQRTAAFLTGCYTGQVMYAQYQENPNRDTQPFAKKFIGRKLDRERLERLYDEGKDKLNQYEKTYLVRDLEPILAHTWVKAGEGWDLSKEHTTFAFNLGWTLSRQLATSEATSETEEPEAAEVTA